MLTQTEIVRVLYNIHFALDYALSPEVDYALSPEDGWLNKAELSTLYRDRDLMLNRLKFYRR